MQDSLHYSFEGQAARVRSTALLLGNYGTTRSNLSTDAKPALPKISDSDSKQANAQTTVANYVAYPRILEDPAYYNRLINGYSYAFWVDTNPSSGQIDLISSNSITPEKLVGIINTATDILAQYNVLDTTNTYLDGVNPIPLTGVSISTPGTFIRFGTVPNCGSQGVTAPVMVYRPRPASQRYNYDPDICLKIGSATLTGVTTTNTVQRAGAISVITGIAATAVTSGTIVINVNGVAKATLTFTTSTTAVGSGVFFTAATAGLWLNEGDIVTCTFTLTGGSLPVVTLSNS
jgi:hypothetical protein